MKTKKRTAPAKTAKVIKEYKTKFKGYDLIVPVGATVTNVTACGPDDTYRFWQDWKAQAFALTGFADSILAHDLTHYGLNVPADHCEPYAI
jgi:hypothetical protein